MLRYRTLKIISSWNTLLYISKRGPSETETGHRVISNQISDEIIFLYLRHKTAWQKEKWNRPWRLCTFSCEETYQRRFTAAKSSEHEAHLSIVYRRKRENYLDCYSFKSSIFIQTKYSPSLDEYSVRFAEFPQRETSISLLWISSRFPSIIPTWVLVAARFRGRLVDDRRCEVERCLVETTTPVEIKTILIRKAELTRWSREGISLVSPSKQNLLNQSGMRDREQRKSRADSMSSCPRDDANSRHAFVRRWRMQG